MDILLAILLFVCIHQFLKSLVAAAAVKQVEIKIPCPPHKWEYDEQDLLRCTICKRRPGEL